VTTPVDAVEAKEIALFAHKYIGPMYIRAAMGAWGRGVPTLYDDDYEYRLGRAPVVRDGDDVTVIGMQEWVYNAILATEQLSKEGIDVRVIDMSTIKPIDEQAIVKAAQETGAIVTAESTNIHGGLLLPCSHDAFRPR
jgi:transketolase